MQLTDKIFKGLYRRGVMLEQMKEPALSRTVKQMEPAEPCENPRDIDALSPEEILRAAEEADIVDETDGRPLAEKLREAMGSGTMLLIDAIDDEPYVSSQMGPMLALRDQCAGGIRLAARALGTTDATVLVYRHISDSEVAIPRNIGGIPIKRVGGKYPAQCQMEEELAERYSGKGSWLLCGACAMIHLYRAAVEGRPQTTTFVTVAGNCVGFPRNVEAPLGTPVLELLKLCGLTCADIDLFGVNAGPGSFTGLRIGLAAVKGLAFPRETLCAPVSTLEALAAAHTGEGTVLCALDARRAQVYSAAFDLATHTRLLDDDARAVADLAQFVENCKKPLFFVGDGASLCYNKYSSVPGVLQAPAALRGGRAAAVALVAKQMAEAGKAVLPEALLPDYHRLSQAERERAERLAAEAAAKKEKA